MIQSIWLYFLKSIFVFFFIQILIIKNFAWNIYNHLNTSLTCGTLLHKFKRSGKTKKAIEFSKNKM